MKNVKTILAIVGVTIGLTAAFSLIAAKITDDSLKVGNPSSTSSKVLEFDTNDGTSNAKITVDDSGHDFSFDNSDNLTFGSGAAANQNMILNKGSGASNPKIRWNNATATLQFADDGSTWRSFSDQTPLSIGAAELTYGAVHNLQIQYSGGIIVKAADAVTNLSALNPGIVVVPKSGSYELLALKFESNVSITNANFVGNWDTVAGQAWAWDKHFVIHACNYDNTNANAFIMIALYPNVVTPASANDIGYEANAAPVASYSNVYIAKASITPANYLNKMCIPIGSVRATKNASDVWSFAVGDLGIASKDVALKYWGSGVLQEYNYFGAQATSTGMLMNAGFPSWSGAPICSGYQPLYTWETLPPASRIVLRYETQACGAVTNGSNTSALQIALPRPIRDNFNFMARPCGTVKLGGVTQIALCQGLGGERQVSILKPDGTSVLNNSFSNSGDDISIEFTYQYK